MAEQPSRSQNSRGERKPGGRKSAKNACYIHDRANLLFLPALCLLSVAGLTGHVDPSLVTKWFIAYITADFVWLCIRPDAVPSMHLVVLTHHAITLLLLLFPLLNPGFARFTCLDGLTEINTVFVIARRHLRSRRLRALSNAGHWATFFPLRFLLYPALILRFWQVLADFPLWQRLWVCGSQAGLCCFNCLFLHAILTRHRVYSSVAAAFSSETDLTKRN